MTTFSGTPSFQDTFTEGSDTALGSHTPDVGTSWTVSTGAFQVVAASDYLNATVAGFSRATANPVSAFNANMAVEAFIAVDVNADFTGILGRYTHIGSGDNFTAYAAFWRSNTVYLYERVGGTSWTLHGSTTVTQAVGYGIRLELDDDDANNIQLWTDTGSGWTLQLSASDATLTSGGAGVRAITNEELDDFAVYEAAAGGGRVYYGQTMNGMI